MKKYIIAIDAGTTGITLLLFNKEAKAVKKVYSEFSQIYPNPGWVEHSPIEIWEIVQLLLKELTKDILPESIASIGITNQRETTVIWDKSNSKPIYNAIVWQCTRTSMFCNQLKEQGHAERFFSKTGLILDSYFSGTKINWILNNVENAREMAKNGDLLFGTIDTWLIWNLTNGKSHLTDYTNASRTLVYNIDAKEWDKELLELLEIPSNILPQVQSSSSDFGVTDTSILGRNIPISGVAGDQQSALYGQLAFEKGMSKCTYGTGCFLLTNTGNTRINSKNGLLTTLACDAWGNPTYALEGSVFIGGAVIQWLRDELNLIQSASETNDIANSINSNGDVYIVPAFSGLGAPHWDMDARGLITGITRDTNTSHFIRAALESIAFQVHDLLTSVQLDLGVNLSSLKVDGGATQNNFLMQFQSDILNFDIKRPENIETTALGAALLAGLAVKFWASPNDFKDTIKVNKSFTPSMDNTLRTSLLLGWSDAISRTLTNKGK